MKTAKISTILDQIDSGQIALPEFQRGYVWNRDQVKALFDSLYRRHPVGGLLVWSTESKLNVQRGNGARDSGFVNLLLDGQQRITSLYGVVRGRPPQFFDGNARAFEGLRFHLDSTSFEFFHPRMKDDPLWVDVTELLHEAESGLAAYIARLAPMGLSPETFARYVSLLGQLSGIMKIELHIEEVTGPDKTLDVVVDIFNRVNSGGTKLSQGDLALAKICADWPGGRDALKAKLQEWRRAGYDFNLDWLLRSINTVLTGEARFQFLHDRGAEEVAAALNRTGQHLDHILELIAGRLGLDHAQVLFGRFGIPVMARYLEWRHRQKLGSMNEQERDKLLFWYVQAAMWGRFSGSTESFIDKDLAALEDDPSNLNALLEQLRVWRGGLRAEPGHFTGWSLGARFYPVLYMLTRMGGARDWGNGLALRANMLGKMSRLEVHHVFPKAQLYKRNYKKPEVNALANFCFLTKSTNLVISDRLPERYFPEIEDRHPGALASQWIPMDPELWKIERYLDFLEARKALLADELNRRMEDLLHGDTTWLTGPASPQPPISVVGSSSQEEEVELEALNAWVAEQSLPTGCLAYDFADEQTGQQIAIFDLAWPHGLQEELSQPVAVLLNEEPATIALASQAGFRCFTSVNAFKKYVLAEMLVDETMNQGPGPTLASAAT